MISSQAVSVVFSLSIHPETPCNCGRPTSSTTVYEVHDYVAAETIVPHCSASPTASTSIRHHSVFPSIMHKTIIFAHTAINPQIAIANSRCNQYSAKSVISLFLQHFIQSCRRRKSAYSPSLIDDCDDKSEDSEDDKASRRLDVSRMGCDL